MNVFIIPSWYPSTSNPIYGIFNREQAEMMARERPDWSVGVSTWGQGHEPFLLRAKDPMSFFKLFKMKGSSEHQNGDNLKEYFNGAFTWTQKFRRGNINGIIKANDFNFQRFVSDFGKPDIISAQATYPAGLVAQALSEKYQIPYTITLRMSPFPFPQYVADGQIVSHINQPLTKADLLIATSSALKERAESFGLDSVQTLNNPVDTTFFQQITNERSDVTTALSIGRMEDQKGIDLLLKALVDVPALQLRIGGDGSKKREYQQLAKKLGLDNRVTWLNELSREQVRNEMQTCSFYVLPSRHETFGNVILEAMACAKPVVATKCGGPNDLVTPDVGYLCEIEVNDLAKKIDKMTLGFDSFNPETIRKHIEENHSPKVWIQKLENVFKSVVKK